MTRHRSIICSIRQHGEAAGDVLIAPGGFVDQARGLGAVGGDALHFPALEAAEQVGGVDAATRLSLGER